MKTNSVNQSYKTNPNIIHQICMKTNANNDLHNRTTLTKSHCIVWSCLQSMLITQNCLLRPSQSLEKAKETSCFFSNTSAGTCSYPTLLAQCMTAYLINVPKVQISIWKGRFEFYSLLEIQKFI